MTTRNVARLAILSSSLMLAAFFGGCGSSSPANSGKGGHDGGSDVATGAGGSVSTGAAGNNSGGAGTTGAAGDTTGAAGMTTGAGGATAGTSGGAGTTGSGGATAGTSGGAGTTGTAGTGAGGSKADAGTDAVTTPCMAGATCADGFTCTNARACGPNREQICYCDPMNKVACEGCTTVDAGTDAGTLAACPANVMNHNATCSMTGERCAASACTNKHQDVCICAVFGAATTGNWFCTTVMCQ